MKFISRIRLYHIPILISYYRNPHTSNVYLNTLYSTPFVYKSTLVFFRSYIYGFDSRLTFLNFILRLSTGLPYHKDLGFPVSIFLNNHFLLLLIVEYTPSCYWFMRFSTYITIRRNNFNYSVQTVALYKIT